MASTLASLGLAALALSTGAAAAQRYDVADEYNTGNFFSKFDFFVSDYSSPDYNDVDPSSGYVNYRSEADAKDLGLIGIQGSEVYMGVNHADTFTNPGKGRDSVRIESKARYGQGLFIADFTHLPKPVCGQWPAFWMYGDEWPTKGEMDIFETYNMQGNSVILHVDKEATVGSCKLVSGEMTGTISTSNCDNYYETPGGGGPQYKNQGCGVAETVGTFYNPSGAIYAMEWSSKNISVWSWTHGNAPSDIHGDHPDPRGWGTPSFYIAKSTCDIDTVLKEQKLVLNIDFCGVLAGNQDIWQYQGCQASTKKATCADWVKDNPDEFNDSFFKIAGIKYFKLKDVAATTTTTTTSTTSATSTSSLTTTTTSVTTTTSSSSSSSSSSQSSSSTSSTSSSSVTTTTSSSSSSSSSSDSTVSTTSASSTSSSSSSSASTTSASTSSSSSSTASSTSVTSGTSTSSSSGSSGTTSSTSSSSASLPFTNSTTTSHSSVSGTSTSLTTTGSGTSSTSGSGGVTTTSGSGGVTTPPPSSSVAMTTSTIFSTITYTITACPAGVIHCPGIGTVTTTVISRVTVCPVTPTPVPSEWVTSTITRTVTFTVTACAPHVVGCRVGGVTSKVITTTTVCPPGYKAGSGPATPIALGTATYRPTVGFGGCGSGGCKPIATAAAACSGAGCSAAGKSSGSAVGTGALPKSSGSSSAVCTGANCGSGSSGSGSACVGADCPGGKVTAGAGMVGVSAAFGLVVAGAALVLAL